MTFSGVDLVLLLLLIFLGLIFVVLIFGIIKTHHEWRELKKHRKKQRKVSLIESPKHRTKIEYKMNNHNLYQISDHDDSGETESHTTDIDITPNDNDIIVHEFNQLNTHPHQISMPSMNNQDIYHLRVPYNITVNDPQQNNTNPNTNINNNNNIHNNNNINNNNGGHIGDHNSGHNNNNIDPGSSQFTSQFRQPPSNGYGISRGLGGPNINNKSEISSLTSNNNNNNNNINNNNIRRSYIDDLNHNITHDYQNGNDNIIHEEVYDDTDHTQTIELTKTLHLFV